MEKNVFYYPKQKYLLEDGDNSVLFHMTLYPLLC